MTRFLFAFRPAYLVAGLPFGITPRTAYVDVDDARLRVRFGLWRLDTTLDNIAGVEASGPSRFLKTAGSARLSFSDRGVTFATNGEQGVCLKFRAPVRTLDPTGLLLRHPGATMTLADVDGFVDLLRTHLLTAA